MQQDPMNRTGPIGVGAVGTLPAEDGGLLSQLPVTDAFELVAFSDEGLDEEIRTEDPVRYCPDYNVLLQDPNVELVLVEGPVDTRRDQAVRALNAGRHVVTARPFAETAADAQRILKTALRAGLLATMDMPWRDDRDLLAVQAALAGESVGKVAGITAYRGLDAIEGAGPLAQIGLEVLDQMHLLLRQDAKTVSAHVVSGAGGGPEVGFLIYMPLRRGGWAVAQAGPEARPPLPRWVAHAPGVVITARDGTAVAASASGSRVCEAPPAAEGFWENLQRVIREGAEPKCHPADIVRAMKLHEAALASAEDGEAVPI